MLNKKAFLIVDESGKRLDAFVAEKTSIPRSQVKRLIDSGMVKVNGAPAKPSRKLKVGEGVEIIKPPPQELKIMPEEIQLEVIYEDDDILAINKPWGQVVHPGPGHSSGTIANAILRRMGGEPIEGSELDKLRMKLGIVHRLDKETSGVLIIAKNEVTHRRLSSLFAGRWIEKEYLAVVWGEISSEGEISVPLKRFMKKIVVSDDGKWSLTKWKLESTSSGLSVVRVLPITGRTHQIRVHFSHMGHPVLGDSLYGGAGKRLKSLPEKLKSAISKVIEEGGMFLHALSIKIDDLEISAPPPPEFEKLTKLLTQCG